MSSQPLAINITPGDHEPYWHIGGLTLNGNTIIGTLVAGLFIVLIGFLIRRKASATKPTKLQLVFETISQQVEEQVESSMGVRTAPWVVPFAMALFVFILIANWIAVIPTGNHPEYAPPPASDVNLTYALAIVVIGTMHVVGVRKRGFKGYYGHLFRKPRVLIPLNILEEIIKPVTLSLRLFGNIFAGTIMVALIAALPAWILWAPTVLWKLFDMFIGLIQAFIFGLLTILYLSSVKPAEEGAHH
ncbi:MAG: F0F1 ATP synthase subunit A [Actinobacteria bacterium]|nr:F0F1 ATP synthase subunit A [Actinomycetota bacterium]